MLNSGYQEGSFSAQISQYRTQAAHLEAENIQLKNVLLEMRSRIVELENRINSLQTPEQNINEAATLETTTKKTKQKKDETKE